MRLVSAAMQAEPIEFPSAGGTCRGVLYRTDRPSAERPGVVILAHGLSGTRLTQYDRRARRLVQDGVAVLDFDPRFVGTSPGTPRQRIDAFAWLDDLRAAVAHVRSRDDVDAQRVGLYGSSLGGGLALAVAVEDSDIRAIALDVPAIDGMRATPSPVRSRPALLAAVARDVLGRRRGRPPVLLPVFGEVGSGAVVQNDVDGFWCAMDEIEGIEWIEPRRVARHAETGEWRNQATALELISSVRLRPARRAAAVRCRGARTPLRGRPRRPLRPDAQGAWPDRRRGHQDPARRTLRPFLRRRLRDDHRRAGRVLRARTGTGVARARSPANELASRNGASASDNDEQCDLMSWAESRRPVARPFEHAATVRRSRGGR